MKLIGSNTDKSGADISASVSMAVARASDQVRNKQMLDSRLNADEKLAVAQIIQMQYDSNSTRLLVSLSLLAISGASAGAILAT